MAAHVKDEATTLLLIKQQQILERLAELKSGQDALTQEWHAKVDRLLEKLDTHHRPQSVHSVQAPGPRSMGAPRPPSSGTREPLRGLGHEPLNLPNAVHMPAQNGNDAVFFGHNDLEMPGGIHASSGNMPNVHASSLNEPPELAKNPHAVRSQAPLYPYGEPPDLSGVDVDSASFASSPPGDDGLLIDDVSSSLSHYDAFRAKSIQTKPDAWDMAHLDSKISTASNLNGVRRAASFGQPRKNTKLTIFDLRSRDGNKIDSDTCILTSRRQEVQDGYSKLLRFTKSRVFDAVVTVVIVLNTAFIGWQTQAISKIVESSFYARTTYNDSSPEFFVAVQALFTFLFLTDVGLRWLAEGCWGFFFFGSEWAWNVFDFFTVVIGLVDLGLELMDSGASLGGASAVRVLRILRLVRVVRVIRTYSFFRELRMMVDSCLNGLRSYMWCFAVIFIMIYVFGVTITTHAYMHIADSGLYSDNAELKALHDSFGTLANSMLSLFQSITGGRDWGEFYVEIGLLGGLDLALFWLFLSFATLAVLNAVAAVFVESTMKSSQQDRELLIKEHLENAETYRKQITHVFREMDAEGTGFLTEDQFMQHLNDNRVKAYFDTLHLDVSDAATLFRLLDRDASGGIEFNEFLDGCKALKGAARSVDMKFLRFEMEAVRRDLRLLTQRGRHASQAQVFLDQC